MNSIIFVVLLCPFVSWGHMGHDHEHHDHDPSHQQAEGIPETDPKWTSAHSLAYEQTSQPGVDLKWDDGQSGYVTMKMAARTEGWVSVGFCAVWRGSMEGCDIVLGWVDLAGTPHLYDYYASGNEHPVKDAKQDYELISGKQENGITSIVFKRKWDTGDDNNDANLEHNTQVHVIYAWSSQDPISADEFQQHQTETRGHTLKPVTIRGHQHGNGVVKSSSIVNNILCIIATLVFGLRT